MERALYLIYRAVIAVLERLPLGMVYRLGQVLGGAAYLLSGRYRRLAIHNLTIAFRRDAAFSPSDIRGLAWRHFLTLGANLLSSVKVASMSEEQVRSVVSVENIAAMQAAIDRGRGVVQVLSHMGSWEMFAQLIPFLPPIRWSTIYQPLRNRFIEAHIQRTRARRGVVLFDRKSGFRAPLEFLRAGDVVGVLVDQHAGDGGVWTPFFGKLASTSPLAALLALRGGAELVLFTIHTAGPGRWRAVFSPALSRVDEITGKALDAGQLTLRINGAVEEQIRASPEDWFWVHNRWKTPKPEFLLTNYRRGVVLPDESLPVTAETGFTEASGNSALHPAPVPLSPFRILIRSTNWLGDAVMSIPAVRAVAAGRPDAEVTILTHAKLADLWRTVPGVAGVLPIEAGEEGILAVSRKVRSAGPFDAVVLLPNSLRSALEVFLAGIPRRVGFPGHWRRHLLNQIAPEPEPPRDGSVRHQQFCYLALALHIGADICQHPVVSAPRRPLERGAWPRFALCPGAEYGPAKRWPAERFAETARRVAAERPCRWVLVGTPKDEGAGAQIETELGGPEACENLIGKTTLGELMEVLRDCHVLLTNDTGTMHLAAWLGVPVVAIFGSTEPRLTGPLAAGPGRVSILRHQVECSPCFLRECPLDMRCMKAVGTDEAVAAVHALASAFQMENAPVPPRAEDINGQCRSDGSIAETPSLL